VLVQRIESRDPTVAVDEVPERAGELVIVVKVVDAVVVVERAAELRPELLPVGVGDAERRGSDVSQATDKTPPVSRNVRR